MMMMMMITSLTKLCTAAENHSCHSLTHQVVLESDVMQYTLTFVPSLFFVFFFLAFVAFNSLFSFCFPHKMHRGALRLRFALSFSM